MRQFKESRPVQPIRRPLAFRIRTRLPLAIGLAAFIIGVAGPQVAFGSSSRVQTSALPGAPTIMYISVGKGSGGVVTLSVSFIPGQTSRKNPLRQTIVVTDNARCVAQRAARFCRIRIKEGATLTLRARSRTKSGFGAWSQTVKFEAIQGNWWKGGKSAGDGASGSKQVSTTAPKVSVDTSVANAPVTTTQRSAVETSSTLASTTTVAATPSTTTLPAPRVDTSRARVLVTSSAKLEKIEGLLKSGVAAQGVRTQTISKFAIGDVVFKSVGVVAFAQLVESSRSGSRLLAVSSTGEMAEALINGTATIDEFFVAPNGRTFILFTNKVSLTSGSPRCLLAELNIETGIPRCVDPTVDRIKWKFASEEIYRNQPIQFDSAGNTYFVGYGADGNFLRRISAGGSTDIINGNIEIFDFVAMPDGDLVVSGQTISSRVTWIRRYPADGGLVNLSVGANWGSISRFVDGNVYLGQQEFVRRYLASTKSLEEKTWVSKDRSQATSATYHDALLWCNEKDVGYSKTLCQASLGHWERPLNILGQKNYVVLHSPRILMQYYPAVERANSVVADVVSSQLVGTRIVLAGTNSAKKQVMTVYDSTSNAETIVMDGSNEIEIYSMSYVPSTNSVMFSGLRFSDNKFVIGEVSLS